MISTWILTKCSTINDILMKLKIIYICKDDDREKGWKATKIVSFELWQIMRFTVNLYCCLLLLRVD